MTAPGTTVQDGTEGAERSLPLAPAGGWQPVMMATGNSLHVLHPHDDPRGMPEDRHSLCGKAMVFPVYPPAVPTDFAEQPAFCRMCRKAMSGYAEAPALSTGPDPLLRLLRAGGLDEEAAAAAAGIARGYLAAELDSALARGQVAVNQRANRRAYAARDTSALRLGSLMLGWARDAVHGRRVWPPTIVGDPPGGPE